MPLSNKKLRAVFSSIKSKFLGKASGNVLRGMGILALGSGGGRLIGAAAIPILTRIYSPEDFGVLSVFVALVSILAPIVTLRYVLALPLPRHDGIALNIISLAALSMLAISLLIGLAFWCFGEALMIALSMESLISWRWLIVVGVITTACYEALTYFSTRMRAYKVIAKTNVWQNFIGVLVKIALGAISLKPFGLLIGQVVAQSGGIGSLWRGSREVFNKNWRYVNISRMRKVAWRYRDFPIYRVPSQVLMVFSVQAPLLFLAALYDVEVTGQLGLAFMALALPISLFGQTTAQAFYAEASRLGANQPKAVKVMLHEVLVKLGLIAIVPTLILFFWGENLFSVFFGENWRRAGTFSEALSIYLFFQFLQTPVAHVFYIFEGQRVLLFLNFQRVLLICAVFGSATWFSWEPMQTIYVYALFLGIHYALSTFYALRFIPTKASN